jgi:hypothetical protein
MVVKVNSNKSIQERVSEIKKMMERRSPDITVFIVIDEMSQYIGGMNLRC